MKKKLFFAAVALVALASCTVDEFVGEDTSLTTSNTDGAIQFVSSTPRITRAEGSAAAQELGYSFAVYATKTVGSTTSNVFAHNVYSASATTNTPYWVWYNNDPSSTANTTTSNTHDWEYVGAAGEKSIPGSGTFNLPSTQEIKYWDYSATQYDFTAYKAKAGGTVSNVTTTGFSFSGTAAQFAGLYVADKLTITEKANPAAHTTADNKIGDAVKFTFRNAAAKVRLGIYETIPGYYVRNVVFKPTSPANFTATADYARLSGSFNGSSATSSGDFTITYDESNTPKIAKFATTSTASNDFIFGTFTSSGTNYLGESSTSPTWALTETSDYISVLPNQDHTGNMTLKVDYDLYNAVSGETIHVTDAIAVVPQMYMTWNPNFAYTYLFKISDNTNGKTGGDGTPEGLFPITFDAVTIAATDGQEVGTITTVSTPAITTYQNGSVSSAGITYATATATEPIYITVNTDGTLASLTTDNIKLYTVAAGTTEADLILTNITKTASGLLSILSADETSQGITFTSAKAAKFTPVAGTTYAVEFTDGSSVKHYKVIVVAPAS